MDVSKAMQVSALALKAQGMRMRVIAENLANADSAAPASGGEPYRRKMVTFAQTVDRASGISSVKVAGVVEDPTELPKKLDPGNLAADKDGYVLMPNVNPLIEMMDMQEAQRSYQANLSSIELGKSMVMRTIDLLKG